MANSSNPLLISIVGPTAVGKTGLSIKLAQWLNTEIISADSRQFYREMMIGTAKPTPQELSLVPHHFIDSHSIVEVYNAGEFGRDASKKIEEISKENPIVLAVGGSGLYLKALWEGFDDMPEINSEIRNQLNNEFEDGGLEELLKELKREDLTYYKEVDENNSQRIIRALEVIRTTSKPFSSFRKKIKKGVPYQNLKIGLHMDRELLFEKINYRMDLMIKDGLFEEAENLYEFKAHNALQTVGYSEIFRFMNGEYDKEEAVRLLKRNSRRYAKRQLTWFRRDEDIHWFNPNQEDEIKSLIKTKIH
ncbi:tRNA (adenosine(37)-N6)-dimethylallyltransferase MiaA [Ekhidna sp.]